MERLTWVSGAFAARVVAARLLSEGVDAELRGAVDGPYALTVGELARVEVWVPADQLDDARMVLLVDEVEAAMQPGPVVTATRTARWPVWLAVAAVTAGGCLPLVRALLG